MKKTFPTRVLALLLCVAMLATVTPLFAAAESATYLDYNETTGKTDVESTATGVHVIDEATHAFVTGWNIVKGDVEIEDRIELPENVNLILANGATLTAKKGITVDLSGTFSIYAQSNDAATMGQLVVPAGVERNQAGIGNSGGYSACGDIVIYGGRITTQGGDSGAGIGGAGPNSSCGNITIRGGIVTAQGGGYAAGIGNGSNNQYSSSFNITISGGYVKATANEDANPIGAGKYSTCGTVSITGSRTSVRDDDTRCVTQYINYETPALNPTCTEAGYAAYYIDPVSGLYYTAISLAADKLIGDAEALAAWKAEKGGGYVAPLGHVWQFVDEDTHKCTRCEATSAHTDADKDYYCDDCGNVLLAAAQADAARLGEAKGEAKAALDAAAKPVGSDVQAQVLSDAKAAVDAAATLDGVATAKADGLSAIAAQKATDLAAKIAELKADITDNLLPTAKCDEAKDLLNTALNELDAAATESDANDLYTTAKDEASGKDTEFTDKLTDYKATFSLAITDAASEETEQFVEDTLTALDNATSIAALDEIYAENEPLVSFHATKDTMLSQCKEILETFDGTAAMKALFEMTVEMLSETTNMDELDEAYAYCAEQIELQRERESYLPECEMILASDAYSDEVKALVREFVEALNAAESLDEIEYVFYDYAPAINLQAARDEWMAELEDLLPDEPSDAVKAIIEGAQELILYGEDTSVFDNVFDIARQAVERQLATEANTQAMEDLLKQTAEDLEAANDTIDELNNTVKSNEATIAEKQAALDTATEQLNAAKADLETAKAQIVVLETATAEQEKALAQAEQQMKDLQAEIERLKALLDDDPTDPQPTNPTDPTGTETEPSATDPTGTGADEGMLGDANGDGNVNMKDVLLMRKYLAGMDVTYNAANSDCNGDGVVNMKDVLLLRKFLADMIEMLGA